MSNPPQDHKLQNNPDANLVASDAIAERNENSIEQDNESKKMNAQKPEIDRDKSRHILADLKNTMQISRERDSIRHSTQVNLEEDLPSLKQILSSPRSKSESSLAQNPIRPQSCLVTEQQHSQTSAGLRRRSSSMMTSQIRDCAQKATNYKLRTIGAKLRHISEHFERELKSVDIASLDQRDHRDPQANSCHSQGGHDVISSIAVSEWSKLVLLVGISTTLKFAY